MGSVHLLIQITSVILLCYILQSLHPISTVMPKTLPEYWYLYTSLLFASSILFESYLNKLLVSTHTTYFEPDDLGTIPGT